MTDVSEAPLTVAWKDAVPPSVRVREVGLTEMETVCAAIGFAKTTKKKIGAAARIRYRTRRAAEKRSRGITQTS